MKIHSILRKIYISFSKTRLGEIYHFHPYMNDKKYIQNLYKKRFGILPDLDDPKNFNEKNNWRKLNDRQSIYTDMVDKYRIKGIIAERIGQEYTFPLLGVWDRPEDIDFDSLPSQFVLKVNHAGGVIICRDKEKFNQTGVLKELKEALRVDYFSPSREWPYKNVKKKIIAEQYMGENLIDYKNYCFNGKLKYTFVWQNTPRDDGRKPIPFFCGAYDNKWVKSRIEIDYPSIDKEIKKPSCYDELVRVSELMSKDIPFVRVDCYIINNCVFVGEMTFFPWGGFMKFKDEKWNKLFGDLERLQDPKENRANE